MTLPLKVISAVGTLGVIGGSVGAIYHFNKETATIENRLAKAGFQVLNVDGEDAEWDKVLTAYNTIQKQEEIFSGSALKQESKEKLKQKCKEAFSKNKDYSLASRWCVKEQTVAQMLTNNGYTKLQNISTSEDVKRKWKEKLNKLENIAVNNRNIQVDLTGNEEAKIKALENFCTTLKIDSLKTHEDKEFEKKFNQAKEWCSVKDNS